MGRLIAVLVAFMAVGVLIGHSASAQSGMNKATAKLLVGDLIDAGLAPTIRETGPDQYVIVVTADPSSLPTAQQVHNFATNRSVTARVAMVQFQ